MDRIILRNVTLINGNGEVPLKHTDIFIEKSRITKIAPFGQEEIGRAIVIDLAGMSVMPGLINTHVHITLEPVGNPLSLLISESSAKTALRAANNLKKQLHSGVTFFRDLGAPAYIDIDLRDSVKAGLILGPNFQTAGQALTMTGGHGYHFSRECDGVDDVRKAAREQLKAGADVIKIMATGGVMTRGVEPSSTQFTLEEMAVAVDEAHKAGKKTAAHAQGSVGIKNAILAGIDSIEHGIFLDDELVEMMLTHNVYLVPTLLAPYLIVKHGVEGGIPDYAVDKTKNMIGVHRQSFNRALKAGVKIAMGTDAGTPFNSHEGAPWEIELMVDYGMSNSQAITAATLRAAELLGIDNDYGTVEEGKIADLLVISGNPLDDIKALRNINQVYKSGIPVFNNSLSS